MFGDGNGNNGAFSASNQYGTVAPITATDAVAYSGNANVVTTNGYQVITTANTGTVLVTVVIAGQVFTINVVVQ